VARLLVQHISAELTRLPAAFERTTIAVVADLHARIGGAVSVVQLVEQINELDADLVVLLGDMVHSPRRGRELLVSLSGLRARHGVWACLGNHEHGFVWSSRYLGTCRHPSVEEWRGMYAESGIRLLANESTVLSNTGERLWLAGIDDAYSGRADLGAALDGVNRDGCVVAITHSPDVMDSEGIAAVDMVIAGHTHGGQICLPGIGAIWAPCRRPRKRAFGFVEGERTRLFVTRGVGEGLPVRIGCPREIGLVTLVRPGSEASG
jgi:predicted MPP superfamily phosphohydrolase